MVKYWLLPSGNVLPDRNICSTDTSGRWLARAFTSSAIAASSVAPAGFSVSVTGLAPPGVPSSYTMVYSHVFTDSPSSGLLSQMTSRTFSLLPLRLFAEQFAEARLAVGRGRQPALLRLLQLAGEHRAAAEVDVQPRLAAVQEQRQPAPRSAPR